VPIRPENRDRYPDDWDDISLHVRFGRAGGRCECEGECGRFTHGTSRCSRRQGDRAWGHGPETVLTVAHLDHTPENCDLANLKAMCQGCHLGYDRVHHAQTAARTREALRSAGMEPLFPEAVTRA
jgi:hypothetical protein